jgi:CheY-like chemotaxis protein
VANEIRECADGAEALAAYSANGPNFVGFVLMEIDMKTMNGIPSTAHYDRGSIALLIVISDFIVSSARLFHAIKRIKLCRVSP